MTYREHLHDWGRSQADPFQIAQWLPSQHWVTAVRFHKRSDAEGYLVLLQQILPTVQFTVVLALASEQTAPFDPEPKVKAGVSVC